LLLLSVAKKSGRPKQEMRMGVGQREKRGKVSFVSLAVA
jgi:hypothetical protein